MRLTPLECGLIRVAQMGKTMVERDPNDRSAEAGTLKKPICAHAGFYLKLPVDIGWFFGRFSIPLREGTDENLFA
jgi:hypothetical protein